MKRHLNPGRVSGKAKMSEQQKLRRLRNFTYNNLIHAPLAMARFDLNMNYVFATERWRRDYQISDMELTGKNHYDIFPGLPSQIRKVHRRVLAGEVIQQTEVPFFQFNGKAEYVNWISMPWRDLDENICGIDILSELVTDRIEGQREIARLKQDLQNIVNEKTRRLELLLQNERELNSIKTDLMTMVTHELRTSIGIILSSCHLQDHYQKNGQLKKAETINGLILDTAIGMRRSLDNFFNSKRIQSGLITPVFEPTDLKALVAEVSREIDVSLKKGQKLVIDQGSVPLISLDPLLARHILMNLLSNAIKYSPARSVIQIILRKTKDQVKISVVDQGIGIKLKDQKMLSLKYFRSYNSSSQPGTGMGLYIAFHFASLMHGKIKCKSAPGKGSRFTVALPVNL